MKFLLGLARRNRRRFFEYQRWNAIANGGKIKNKHPYFRGKKFGFDSKGTANFYFLDFVLNFRQGFFNSKNIFYS